MDLFGLGYLLEQNTQKIRIGGFKSKQVRICLQTFSTASHDDVDEGVEARKTIFEDVQGSYGIF